MTTADELIALVRTYNPRSNEKLLREAYAFGAAMHEGQFRHSGEPYFSHPVAVAVILAEQQMDDATIVTALLHDTIEDTATTERPEIPRKSLALCVTSGQPLARAVAAIQASAAEIG